MKKLGTIDFGTTDARHMIFSTQRDQKLFQKIFLKPAHLDEDKFVDGRKSIVYGIKGAGKSAWLKYLEIGLRKKGKTKFFYFRKETDKFFDEKQAPSEGAEEIRNSESLSKTEVRDFWRLLVTLAVANQLFDDGSPQARSFVSLVREAVQENSSWVDAIKRKVPIVESFVARISGKPELTISGKFDAQIPRRFDDEDLYTVLLGRDNPAPIYFFFDEMEVSFTSDERFASELALVSGLIETLRDMNEVFRKGGIPIYLIAAIRKEISDGIIGGDTSKIVNDLGQEISWHRRSWSKYDKEFIHPLFEIVLRHIAFSEDPLRDEMPKIVARRIIDERFPAHIQSGNIQKDILDLTMYRPRDCILLFNVCSQIDKNLVRFRKETFKIDYRAQFGNRVWVDMQEALSAKYGKKMINALRRVLSATSGEFDIEEFFNTVDDFSYDPDIAALVDMSALTWVNMLKDLFELGAVGNLDAEGKYRFRFRGQHALDVRKGQRIILHQSLVGELS